MMAIAHPIYKGKAFLGTVIIELEMRYLVAMISPTRIGKTGYTFITNNNGFAIVHPGMKEIHGENVYQEKGMESLSEKLKMKETGSAEYTFRGVRNSLDLPIWNGPAGMWSLARTEPKS